MGYITKEGLHNLHSYKYISGGYSVIDNIMDKFWWQQVIKVMPMVIHQPMLFRSSL